jgi:two-component system, OmpR family, response regulator
VDVHAEVELALTESFIGQRDAAVLALSLPRKSGIQVLRHRRAQSAKRPVLLLSMRDELTNRVQGLDAGADGYLVKPFESPKFLARLRVFKRRRVQWRDAVLADLDWNLTDRRVNVFRLRERSADLSIVIRTVLGFGYVMDAARRVSAS